VGGLSAEERLKFRAPILLLILALPCCANEPLEPLKGVPPSCTGTEPLPGALARVSRVVIVVVDGLRPDLIGPERSPNIHRLATEGATTLDARTVRPSLTLPAHTSMVTGLTPAWHRVVWNKHRPRLEKLDIATIFDVAHEAGLGTALFGGKEKLQYLGRPGTVDKIGVVHKSHDATIMAEALAHLKKKKPGLTLIHLPDVDVTGHGAGWGSELQLAALLEADRVIGLLLEALDGTKLGRSTAIVLTADHGGEETMHGPGRALDLEIPWIAWGPGIARQTLPSVCVTSTAPAALDLLGLDPPHEWVLSDP
jgi:hypothetical protein